MNERLKEPRIYLCILAYVFTLLPGMSLNVKVSVLGVSGTSGDALSLIQVLTYTIVGDVVLLIPAMMLLVEIFLRKKINPRITYILGGILGCVMLFVTMLARVRDVTCDNCGAKTSGNMKFCPDCGGKITVRIPPKNCPNCGTPVIVGKKFCVECGERISEE